MQNITAVNLLIKHPIEKNKILAVKRAESDKTYGGMWALPGGKIEIGESVSGAAKRELMEETGLVLENMDNKPFVTIPIKAKGKTFYIGVYLASVSESTPLPHDKDISKAEYINPQVLLDSMRKHKYPEDQIKWAEKFFVSY